MSTSSTPSSAGQSGGVLAVALGEHEAGSRNRLPTKPASGPPAFPISTARTVRGFRIRVLRRRWAAREHRCTNTPMGRAVASVGQSVTLADIRAARAVAAGVAKHTPIVSSVALSQRAAATSC